MAFEKRHLPKKSENVSEWYNTIVYQSELADVSQVRGAMVFRPYGYALWEEAQKFFDRAIKAKGIENAYFPLFIPESLIKKEQKHVEGFSPELAVVTIGGGEELKEKLIIRPTSETIIYDTYARWIHSWRDLPLLINQWCNVVRWEKRTYPFLRTTEFLWQEGHTAHMTHKDALEIVGWTIQAYAKMFREIFAMPGYIGKKSSTERFAGADMTMTYESLMPEGKALQNSTSHDLGQNFSKSFDIQFTDQEGKLQHVWQTSWGFSTRAIGGMILTHGDDQGLRLPPKLAPIQIIILPVKADHALIDYAHEIHQKLTGTELRAKVDARDDQTLGYRINKWELKGVPVRLEIGAKELESKEATAVRRDTGEKIKIPFNELITKIPSILDSIQTHLYNEAEQFLQTNTREAGSYEEFKKIMEGTKGFIKAFWCEDSACEQKIKEETKATTRCLPIDAPEEKGKCVYCGKSATHRWIFAQAY